MSSSGSTDSGSDSSVTDGSIHAVSTSGPARMGVERDVQVGGGELQHGVGEGEADARLDRGIGGL